MLGRADLSQMYEFVIVFENRRVDVTEGDLLIHSIRLAPLENNEAKMDLQMLLDRL